MPVKQVIQSLERLAEVLATENPTRTNLELCMHIDRIECHSDGTVKLRLCKLGLVPDIIDLLATYDNSSNDYLIKNDRARRRNILRVVDEDPIVDLQAQASFVADPNRFEGLGEEWFTTFRFNIPESTSWAKENAEAVFKRRKSAGLPYSKLHKWIHRVS
jgi:hypothetical protein